MVLKNVAAISNIEDTVHWFAVLVNLTGLYVRLRNNVEVDSNIIIACFNIGYY